MGYTKRNKRCIPKEGMSHAHKACQKREIEREKMHTQRRYATCPQCVSKKKKRKRKKRENIAHTKKIYKGKNSYEGVSSTIHQKYPHTCTS
jgi:hypothetical protein